MPVRPSFAYRALTAFTALSLCVLLIIGTTSLAHARPAAGPVASTATAAPAAAEVLAKSQRQGVSKLGLVGNEQFVK